MKLEGHACPKCGKETLEIQQGTDVIWCANLGKHTERPCQFGHGDGEKTLADLPAQNAAWAEPICAM